jgi:hypothetical protein
MATALHNCKCLQHFFLRIRATLTSRACARRQDGFLWPIFSSFLHSFTLCRTCLVLASPVWEHRCTLRSYPNGVASSCARIACVTTRLAAPRLTQPRWGCWCDGIAPRVAARPQPWATVRCPVGAQAPAGACATPLISEFQRVYPSSGDKRSAGILPASPSA